MTWDFFRKWRIFHPGDPPPDRINSRPFMDRALKETVVPELRNAGFRGSYPHFRRPRADRIDLVTFQFNRYGGSFVVELAQCGPDGYATPWGKTIATDKVTAHDLDPSRRKRLGGGSGLGRQDHWFVYDFPQHDPPMASTPAQLEDDCRKAAASVLRDFERQAEAWWEKSAAQSPRET